MIKIYSGDKVIYLTSQIKKQTLAEDAAIIKIEFGREMRVKYKQVLNESDIKVVYFYNRDIDLLFEYFSAMFRNIEAAGGLVKNNSGAYLFILRNGKWDLPKGKKDKGETNRDCAEREVVEECGLRKLTTGKKLITTFHTYFMEERAVLKHVHWFEMACKDSSQVKQQKEEGITEVRWIKKKDFDIVLANTYESIKDVLKEIK